MEDDMAYSMSTLWWIAAGAMVAAELATGTFYLLMIALGLAAGAVAAHAGAATTWQVLAAAAIPRSGIGMAAASRPPHRRARTAT
jgi:membrane protein implicated in regulation of membrane protease activity